MLVSGFQRLKIEKKGMATADTLYAFALRTVKDAMFSRMRLRLTVSYCKPSFNILNNYRTPGVSVVPAILSSIVGRQYLKVDDRAKKCFRALEKIGTSSMVLNDGKLFAILKFYVRKRQLQSANFLNSYSSLILAVIFPRIFFGIYCN